MTLGTSILRFFSGIVDLRCRTFKTLHTSDDTVLHLQKAADVVFVVWVCMFIELLK